MNNGLLTDYCGPAALLQNHEEQRIEALHSYNLLDTPPEPAFDDLALLVTEICQAPIAIVSLMDQDRQWFKARIGLTFSQTPREVSFCDHTLRQKDGLLVVPDAMRDARFEHNPLVTGETGIRAYAGVSLVTASGQAIGTLCALDTSPRDFSPAQCHALRTLSRQVMAQMDLKRLLAEQQQLLTEQARAAEALRESEARFRSTFDQAAIGMGIASPDGRFIEVNAALCHFLGYSEATLLEMTVHQVSVAEDNDKNSRLRQAALNAAAAGEGSRTYRMEKRYRRSDGQIVWGELSGTAVFSSGKPLYAIGQIQDITERKQSEERLAHLMRSARCLLWSAIAWEVEDGGIRWESLHLDDEAGQRFLPLPPIPGRSYFERAYLQRHPEDRKRTDQYFRQKIHQDESFSQEFRCQGSDGEWHWLYETFHLERIDETHWRVVGVVTDITDLKRATEELQNSEERLRALTQFSPDMITILEGEGSVRFQTGATSAVLGYSQTDLIGQNALDYLHPEDRAEVTQVLLDLVSGESQVQTKAFRVRHADGSWRWLEAVGNNQMENPAIRGIVLNSRDITARKEAEEALRRSIGLLQAVMEGTDDAIFVKDRQGRYLMLNTAGTRMIGAGVLEGAGQEVVFASESERAAFLPESDRCVLETGSVQTYEETAASGGAAARTYLTTKAPYRDAEGNIVGVLGISRDITEHKRLQGQIAQQEKLASLGGLVAGVAHEINNPLAVISGQAQLLQMSSDAQIRADGTAIREMAQRAARIMDSLRSYARPAGLAGSSRGNICDLNHVVHSSLDVIAHKLRNFEVDLKMELSEDLPPIPMDTGEIEQVIVNLLSNAGDALRTRPIGTREVRIKTSLDQAGRTVLLSITDNGPGMTEAVKTRIFDPFFTTKDTGEGTGLGMYISYGIVAAHGGTITVETREGGGAAFRVRLPLPANKSAPPR
ncbi:MAG: PAS domain S-box protein [Cytophagales bacterium]|nr:PAS domain S-box protein [Armatimonadota bacterium]